MNTPKLAMFFNKIENSKVRCYLCPHNCIIKPEGVGACRVRKNIDGNLYSLNYSKVTSIALDAIEKKPLYHFKPGTVILSAGTFGCNLKCSFCQNWAIAHENPETYEITPQELADRAKKLVYQGNIGIAYTYNEPSIWYEYVYDTAKIVKEAGLSNVLVTNGFIGIKALEKLLPYIDAMNIDVKAYSNSFYSDICRATLDNVKETVETVAGKCHVEVTTLVIPALNDSVREVSDLCRWLSSVSPKIPLHLSRYFPNYKMDYIQPTPVETLEMAREEALKYMEYVYLGNVW